MSTTSGRSTDAMDTAIVPSLASPATSISGSAVQDQPEALPDQRVVVGQEHGNHDGAVGSRSSRAVTRQPRGRRGPKSSSPPNAPIRSRIPVRPPPAAPALRAASGAVVLDLHADFGWSELQTDRCARCRAGMLHRVRQRFLDQPEDRKLDGRRNIPAGAAALVLHGQAGRRGLGRAAHPDRPGPAAGWRRSPGSALSTPSSLRVSASACASRARHVPDRIGRLLGRADDRAEGPVRQCHDHREVVGDAIVHLAGDAGSVPRSRPVRCSDPVRAQAGGPGRATRRGRPGGCRRTGPG